MASRRDRPGGSAVTDPGALRAEFPVLERIAYLNAGTNGPVPRRSAEAAAAELHREADAGRSGVAHWERMAALVERLRAELASLLRCAPGEVALTRSTTDGVNAVLAGLDLQAGDEVVTSDEEHPGLLAPLAFARRRRGIEVRVVPFGSLADAISSRTRLVACSHVSWISGAVVDAPALAGAGVPLLLDGAQGLGAIPTDVEELGCDFYAASGQKWLCGPDATGCLYVRADRLDLLTPPWPSYFTLAEPARMPEVVPHAGARRLDMGVVPAPAAAAWLASLAVLSGAGWPWVHERGVGLAGSVADALGRAGLAVVPRGPSTLVSWRVRDPVGTVERLARAGTVIRDLPGGGLVRASVGAWSSEEELERLAASAQ